MEPIGHWGRDIAMYRVVRMLGLVAAGIGIAYVATRSWSTLAGLKSRSASVQERSNRSLHDGSASRKDQTTSVYALARLEPAGGLIVVGARPGARIERVLIAVGDGVKAGQPLAILEGQDEARRRLALAEAQQAQARHQRALKRDQLAVERAREDRLQPIRLATLVNTSKALQLEDDRLSSDINLLSKDPKDARQHEELLLKLDEVRIQSYRAMFELEQCRADEALLERKRKIEDQGLADGGPADQALDRQIELARGALDATTVRTPGAGQVLEVHVHGGEVSSGPLATLGDLSAMVAVAEVDQTDAEKVGEGHAAEVTILGRTVPGKVTHVGRLVGRNQLPNADPRAPQDLRVLKVTIRLDTAEPAARFVNMQVEVSIRPGTTPGR
ncbi:MAG: HlyD family efflux transporter periplasmic adaptor subunit [Isosphaeraceae bacterium]|nr:HlyD family efflux transporter periplasmic adaptor subunit [Isosphaeraceae bacterium]